MIIRTEPGGGDMGEKLSTEGRPHAKLLEGEWVRTGIEGFDRLLDEGIPSGSNIVVAGGPGCGKTIFCLQTLYNIARDGHDCIYISMEERPERLFSHMLKFNFDIKEIKRDLDQIMVQAGGAGRILIRRIQPIFVARSVEALLEKASGRLAVDIDIVLDLIPQGFNPSVLAMDSISAIETAFSGRLEQYRIYIEQLFRYFEQLRLTTFMITESAEAPKKLSKTGVEEFLADGIIVFYNYQGEVERIRGVEIFKLRGASHARRIAPMTISNSGMRVFSEKYIKLKSAESAVSAIVDDHNLRR